MKINPTRISTLRGKPYSGFALVKLLVTITITIALASLVFVVTGKVRNNAYQANAMTSLRQVAIASVAYSTENNGDINSLRWVSDPMEGAGSYLKNSFWGRHQPQGTCRVSRRTHRNGLGTDPQARVQVRINAKTHSTAIRKSSQAA